MIFKEIEEKTIFKGYYQLKVGDKNFVGGEQLDV